MAKAYKLADQAGKNGPNLVEIATATATPEEDPGEDLLDPNLIPESTQVDPIQGAEIRSFRILDMEGNPTNLLKLKQDYQFEVSGRFLQDVENVYFGLYIRTLKGARLTGQRYPKDGTLVERVKAGENFRVTYGFKMVMLPGTYFVSVGVWSTNEPNCLHRIMDAMMFRILPEKNILSTGYFDASSMDPVLELSE
jgi:lipopolysaccharide transport system ATP-binding protein